MHRRTFLKALLGVPAAIVAGLPFVGRLLERATNPSPWEVLQRRLTCRRIPIDMSQFTKYLTDTKPYAALDFEKPSPIKFEWIEEA